MKAARRYERSRHDEPLAQRPDVLAYCDAQPRDGGSGAALVLLKVIDLPAE